MPIFRHFCFIGLRFSPFWMWDDSIKYRYIRSAIIAFAHSRNGHLAMFFERHDLYLSHELSRGDDFHGFMRRIRNYYVCYSWLYQVYTMVKSML